MRARRFRLAGTLAGLALALPATSAAEETTALTVYSTAQPGAVPADLYRPRPGSPFQPDYPIPGYAVVRQERSVTLERGRSVVRFMDVAGRIEPTTVSFVSLTDREGTRVLDQSFQFDLVGTEKLLERYVDQQITVEQVHGEQIERTSGRLLSASGGLILAGADGQIRVLNGYSSVLFPTLPGGLITRPTLVWNLDAARGGEHRVRVSYQTEGITWWADYNLLFAPGKDANRGTVDVGAWVSLLNRSGASYREAKLKLIAGDVQRAPEAQPMAKLGRMEAVAAPGFEEKAFFEYHLYTLGRPATIPDNSTQQLELFPAVRAAPAEKILVYYGLPAGYRGAFPAPMTDREFGSESNPKVDVYLRFANTKASGLGVPLPSGRVRVNQLDPADQSLEFIGEDVIDHTPRDEAVLIRLGSAFDVVGERKQTDFQLDTARKTMEERIEIRLRNHKDEPVSVIVKENLYRWANWQILEASPAFEKQDARTVHFPVRIDAHGEAVVRYAVRYTW
ncbi:MAG TPA: hypothetical protein VJS92_04430 [Candidatus Polarisedimenticolaceae bacterium]|nr:hypothetical protein [Candidatus Polarisedimenticolaceae bacterium]